MELKPVTETKEFKDAVALAVASSVEKLKESLLNELVNKSIPGAPTDMKSMMDALAMSIASLTDQGTGRRRFPPETVRKWAEARKVLFQLLREARQAATPPSYRVVAKTLLANQILEPKWIDSTHIAQDTIIDWYGAPNLAMVPVNDIAKRIYFAFQESIDLVDKELPYLQTAENNDKIFVHGQPVAKPRATGMLSFGQAAASEADEGLSVKHKTLAGQTVAKNILGTIAPPIHVPG
jgi:hypothetical protein